MAPTMNCSDQRIMQRLIIKILLLTTVLMLAGCSGWAQQRQNDLLTKILKAYESTLRWGDISNAYGFLHPEQAAKASIPPGLKNIRVTHYEVTKGPQMLDEHTALQEAFIQYIDQYEQREKSISDRQLWEYDAEEKRWFLMSRVPEFSKPKMRVLPLDQ